MNEIDEWIISKINKLIKFDAKNIQTGIYIIIPLTFPIL